MRNQIKETGPETNSVDDLRAILSPRSVAVVGASDRPGRRGHSVVRRLLDTGYAGKIYPVNPRGGTVLGLPMYRNLAEVPGPIDVIDCATKISVLPEILEHAPGLEARGIVIFADSFMDIGEDGLLLQKQVLDGARAAGIRIIGPNTMGLFCGASRFSTLGSMEVANGPIGFISQSGNVGITAMVEASVHGTGLSHFLGVGLQLDIGVHDCIRYLAADDQAQVIAVYIEGIPDGEAFLDAVAEAARFKPVVVFKAGATRSGAQAAASHSGSLATEDRVFTAACIRAGAQRVERSDELLPVALTLAQQPPAAGDRVGLFGSGGGHTVQVADAAERAGLIIPPLPPELEGSLANILPPYAGVSNPADFAGGLPENTYPLTYAMAAELGLSSSDFDGLVMFGMYGGWMPESYENGYLEAAQRIAEYSRRSNKPIVMHTIFARESHRGIQALHENSIPSFNSIETAVRSFGALVDRGSALRRLKRDVQHVECPEAKGNVETIVQEARCSGRSALLESEAAVVLSAYGVPFLPHRVAAQLDDIPAIVAELGFPLAVKVQSAKVVHKTESNGVYLNVRTLDEAVTAYRSVLLAAQEDENATAIIYQMASPKAIELLLGFVRDPHFGPVVTFGIGGVFVEVMNDIALRLPPLDETDVSEMIRELKGRRIIEGIRGRKPVDQDRLTQAILALSELAIDCPEIAEVDVNPLFADGGDLGAADARIILRQS